MHRLLAHAFTHETSPDPAPAPASLDLRIGCCGHQRDHHGPHHATVGAVADLGEPGESDLWWLRWNDSGDQPELLSAPTCPATRRDHTQRVTNACSAPAGHTTPHLWWHDPGGTP